MKYKSKRAFAFNDLGNRFYLKWTCKIPTADNVSYDFFDCGKALLHFPITNQSGSTNKIPVLKCVNKTTKNFLVLYAKAPVLSFTVNRVSSSSAQKQLQKIKRRQIS